MIEMHMSDPLCTLYNDGKPDELLENRRVSLKHHGAFPSHDNDDSC